MTAEDQHKYTELLRARLSGRRFEHSVNVAREAVRLAEKYGADREKAELAGLLHDIMKEESGESQMRYIRVLDKRPDPVLVDSPWLWHGPAAAGYLYRELKIRDRDVLNAVKYHSTARAGMSLLEKIIYLADYTSAERTFSDVGEMRKRVDKELSSAMLFALAYSLGHLSSKERPIHPDALAAYNEIVISGGKYSK